MEKEKTVLIVEDEPKISEVVKAYMENDGWFANVACDAKTALEQFQAEQPDLVILDLILGSASGMELSQKIRARSNIPFIIITSKSREDDRLNGFYMGADDYVVKPFSPKELVARANAVYRRYSMNASKTAQKIVTFDEGRVRVDFQRMEVFVDGREVNLTNMEYKLFSLMAKSPDRVFSRAELLYFAQGYRYAGDARIIDAHIKNIRQKIEDNPKSPRIVQTVVGSGYKIGVRKDE
jgi:DNA-binding response OmpR family regulator